MNSYNFYIYVLKFRKLKPECEFEKILAKTFL